MFLIHEISLFATTELKIKYTQKIKKTIKFLSFKLIVIFFLKKLKK